MSSLLLASDCGTGDVIDRLTSHGIAVLPGYFSHDHVKRIRDECARLERDRSSGIVEREYHCGSSLLVDRRKWNAQAYPVIDNVLDLPLLEAIASRYFNQRAAFNYQFLVTRETASGVPITELHYDRLVTLKFFIYLLDTDRKNGAFECVPGTHKSVAATRAYYVNRGVRLVDLPNFALPPSLGSSIPIEGEAGTMLIFTTDVIHRGGVVSEGCERWVLRAHSRQLPLPEYRPTPWSSRQWWKESLFNPYRYYYRLMDRVTRERPPPIRAQ